LRGELARGGEPGTEVPGCAAWMPPVHFRPLQSSREANPPARYCTFQCCGAGESESRGSRFRARKARGTEVCQGRVRGLESPSYGRVGVLGVGVRGVLGLESPSYGGRV